ncbi:MAG: hypothetical protein WC485_03970 [Opitutaceae bacterium]
MLILADSVMEKLRHLPRHEVVNLGLIILVLIVAVIVIKRAAKMNKLVLGMIILVTIVVVGFTWVYERNEPKFLTPLINQIAPFFPQQPKYKN